MYAVIFDLGGTLMWWPDWVEGAAEKWTAGHTRLVATRPGTWPDAEPFVAAMRAAENEHWTGVEGPMHVSGDPAALVSNGFARLGLSAGEADALAVVHNADLATHGLDALLDATLYTSEVPHSKPHPSVFLEAARRLGVAPEACVMVGDRMIDDVSGAQSAGMRGIWKRNAHTPVRDDIRPDAIVDRVAEVPAIVAGWAVRSSVQESAL